MHLGNEVLSVPVAAVSGAVAIGAVALAARRLRRTAEPAKVPLMGVLGAFVFAAQMVNFPVGFGASGHLVGSILLAVLLGADAAFLAMASILVIQCLIFQDGGILALGCNILNMGLLPCYGGRWMYDRIVPAGRATPSRAWLGMSLACLVTVPLGAVLAALEISISGVSDAPLRTLLWFIAGIHVLIAFGEGILTFAVVGSLARMRPDLAGLDGAGRVSLRAVTASLAAAAAVVAGFLSLVASSLPDGLERTLEHLGVRPAPSPADGVQAAIALFPDYTLPGRSGVWLTPAAGLIGTAVTLAVVWIISRFLRRKSPHAPRLS
ncbi:MAG: energy-coupling factor ABC transporter permease [Planctomycetota bacterium]